MKKVLTAACALRERKIVSIERLYTSSTFHMKSAVPDPPPLVKILIPPLSVPPLLNGYISVGRSIVV